MTGSSKARDETCRETRLMRAIANFYGGPVRSCLRTACRRRRRCSFAYAPATGKRSYCLSGYDEDCEAFILRLWQVCCEMLNGTYGPSREADDRDTVEAAIAICKAAVLPGSAEAQRFRDFLKRYRTPPPTEEQRLVQSYRAQFEADLARIRSLHPAR